MPINPASDPLTLIQKFEADTKYRQAVAMLKGRIHTRDFYNWVYGHKISIDLKICIIASCLRSGFWPASIPVFFRRQQVSHVGVEALAYGLQSGHCPEGLVVDLSDNAIDAIGIVALAAALCSGHSPQRLKLILANTGLGREASIALATALDSGRCPIHLELDLRNNPGIGRDAQGAQVLIDILQSERCPIGLKVAFEGSLRQEQITRLSDRSIAGARGPAMFQQLRPGTVQLTQEQHELYEIGLKLLKEEKFEEFEKWYQAELLKEDFLCRSAVTAFLLKSGVFPCDLPLADILGERPDERATNFSFIADALKSGRCPKNLCLDFTSLDVGSEVSILLANALHSGRCPEGLSLNCIESKMTLRSIVSLASALCSGQAPEGIEPYLGGVELDENNELGGAAIAFAVALRGGRVPSGSTIYPYDWNSSCGCLALARAVGSGFCTHARGLELDWTGSAIDKDICASLQAALSSGRCPKDLLLSLDVFNEDGTQYDRQPKMLFEALKSGFCPEGLRLYLKDSKLTKQDFVELAEALKSGRCPSGLSLKVPLPSDDLLPFATCQLGQALKSGKCPIGLDFSFDGPRYLTNLPSYATRVSTARSVLKKLQSDVQLNICDRFLHKEGLKTAINTACEFLRNADEAQLMEILGTDDTEKNDLVDTYLEVKLGRPWEAAYRLSPSIERPDVLYRDAIHFISLDKNIITPLAEALESGQCPRNFHLTLPRCDFKPLAKALSSKHCPPGLTLGVEIHDLDEESFNSVVDAVKSGNCPAEFTLDCTWRGFTTRDIPRYHHSYPLTGAQRETEKKVNELKRLVFEHNARQYIPFVDMSKGGVLPEVLENEVLEFLAPEGKATQFIGFVRANFGACRAAKRKPEDAECGPPTKKSCLR